MADVRKSVLVPFRPEQMYALVDNVDAYSHFLPWCSYSAVLSRSDAEVIGRLELNYHGVKHGFTTRNRLTPGREIVISLVEGPFSDLNGQWLFLPLGDSGCKVEFDLQYAFSSKLLEKLIGPVFQKVSSSLVDAFIARARQVYA